MSTENSEPFNLSTVPINLEEEDLSQECRDLIATLPADSSWGIPLYLYQGHWLFERPLQGVLNSQKHFHARDSDIHLATAPKSGTTWLKALTFAVLNRKIYNPKSSPDSTQTHPILTANPHALVPCIEFDLYGLRHNPDLTSATSPRLFASHTPYISLPESVKRAGCKIVYLCREPKDLFVSLWHFLKSLRPELCGSISIEDSFEVFCRGVSMYGPFWDHMLGYYKESLERPGKIMFLRFEELKREPERVLKDVAKFIGCGFSEEEESSGVVGDILRLCSFENLSNLEVNKNGFWSPGIENKAFFRRGEVGDWKNFLTVDMIERLNLITQEKLGKHGLKF